MGRGLGFSQRRSVSRIGRVAQDRNARKCGKSCLEYLQPLSAQLSVQVGQPRNVPTRPSKAGNEPRADWIGGDRHDDWDGRCRLLRGRRRWSTLRNDSLDLESRQLGREVRKPFVLSLGRSILNDDVLALHVAAFA